MNVSVVIPTYYRSYDLFRLFESLLQQSVKPVEVLIVDDTPTTVIKHLCEEYTPIFNIVGIVLLYIKRQGFQRSISMARNLGAKTAQGDIVIFIDSDIMLYPDYIGKILSIFRKNPKTMGVGAWFSPSTARQVSARGIRYQSNQTLLKIFALERDSRDSCRNFEYPLVLSRTIHCQWLLGGSMSLRRSVFNEFQFDENLKGYSWGEDFLLSNQINKRYPNSLLITPDAKGINVYSEEARLEEKELFNVQMVNAKYILTTLWGFKGLLLFGRQCLGFFVFKVMKKIRKLFHPIL
jgi:cellulose synthase/poly-beta-1,6-N-acetylglucosamine synthase-like glycosyltransferase